MIAQALVQINHWLLIHSHQPFPGTVKIKSEQHHQCERYRKGDVGRINTPAAKM